ncbi:MAG: DUF2905 domain-containing protein [Verrucomicrobiales bacterium]|nr:DUF2905 domain-containing protein [Verrucomicrobiales bacterium]
MQDLGKILVVIGLAMVGAGVLLWSGLGKTWLGRLPGDLNIERAHFSIHFPIITCLLVSLVLSVLAWWLRR